MQTPRDADLLSTHPPPSSHPAFRMAGFGGGMPSMGGTMEGGMGGMPSMGVMNGGEIPSINGNALFLEVLPALFVHHFSFEFPPSFEFVCGGWPVHCTTRIMCAVYLS